VCGEGIETKEENKTGVRETNGDEKGVCCCWVFGELVGCLGVGVGVCQFESMWLLQ